MKVCEERGHQYTQVVAYQETVQNYEGVKPVTQGRTFTVYSFLCTQCGDIRSTGMKLGDK